MLLKMIYQCYFQLPSIEVCLHILVKVQKALIARESIL